MSSSGSDFVGTIYDSTSGVGAQFLSTVSKHSGVINVANTVPLAARHIIRPLSNWYAIPSSSSSSSTKNTVHLMSYALPSGGSILSRFRQQMFASDFFVVPVNADSFKHNDLGSIGWLDELCTVLELVTSHRAADSGPLFAGPVHVIFHFAAADDEKDSKAAAGEKVSAESVLSSLLPQPAKKTLAHMPHLKLHAVFAAEDRTLSMLQELAAGPSEQQQQEKEQQQKEHVDPASPSMMAPASTFFRCLSLGSGCTDAPNNVTLPRTCIGRATCDSTIVLDQTVVSSDMTHMGASYIVHRAIAGGLHAVPKVAVGSGSPYDEFVESCKKKKDDDSKNDDNNSSVPPPPLSVSVKKGDLVYLILGIPRLRSRIDGSDVPCFMETTMMVPPRKVADQQCPRRPVFFADVANPSVQTQLLLPRLLFIETDGHKGLSDLGREVVLHGLGGITQARIVYTDAGAKRSILACFSGRKDESLVMPQLSWSSAAIKLAAKVATGESTMETVLIKVVAALRTTELAHSVLDELLVSDSCSGSSSSGENADERLMKNVEARLACTGSSAFPGWTLRPNSPSKSNAEERHVWNCLMQALLLELVGINHTAVFAFSRRQDVLRVCRPHAALGMVDLEDTGIVHRSLVTLLTSLRSGPALSSGCKFVEWFLKRLMEEAASSSNGIFDQQLEQRKREFAFWPEPFNTMCTHKDCQGWPTRQRKEWACDYVRGTILAFAGHCCTSKQAFSTVGIPALFGLSTGAFDGMAALRCGHFMYEKLDSPQANIPPLLYECESGIRPSEHDNLGKNLVQYPQVFSRASLAVRFAGYGCFSKKEECKNNFERYLLPQNKGPAATLAKLAKDRPTLCDFAKALAERWVLTIDREMQASLPSNVVIFNASLQQLREMQKYRDVANPGDLPLVMRIDSNLWQIVFSFLATRSKWW